MANMQRGVSRSGQVRQQTISPAEFDLAWRMGGTPHARDGLFKLGMWKNTSTTQDLYSETFISVNFDTSVKLDTDFFTIELGSDSKKTVKRAGWYRITYCLNVTNSTANDALLSLYMLKNGSTALTSSNIKLSCPAAEGYGSCYFSGIFQLAANDYVEVKVKDLLAASSESVCAVGGTWIALELVSCTDEAMIGGQVVAGRSGKIHRAILTKGEDPASSGNTTIDILKNGYTILGSGSLAIAAGTELQIFDHTVFSDVEVSPDDVFEVVVDGTTTPPARDLGLKVIVRPDVDSDQ